jgi:hypothetical protein
MRRDAAADVYCFTVELGSTSMGNILPVRVLTVSCIVVARLKSRRGESACKIKGFPK